MESGTLGQSVGKQVPMPQSRFQGPFALSQVCKMSSQMRARGSHCRRPPGTPGAQRGWRKQQVCWVLCGRGRGPGAQAGARSQHQAHTESRCLCTRSGHHAHQRLKGSQMAQEMGAGPDSRTELQTPNLSS